MSERVNSLFGVIIFKREGQMRIRRWNKTEKSLYFISIIKPKNFNTHRLTIFYRTNKLYCLHEPQMAWE